MLIIDVTITRAPDAIVGEPATAHNRFSGSTSLVPKGIGKNGLSAPEWRSLHDQEMVKCVDPTKSHPPEHISLSIRPPSRPSGMNSTPCPCVPTPMATLVSLGFFDFHSHPPYHLCSGRLPA